MQDTRRWIFEDAITTVLEELIELGCVTRAEVQEVYSIFGNEFVGLLPTCHNGDKQMAIITPTPRALLLHRKEGVVPPDEFLKKANEQFDTFHGYLIVDEGQVTCPYQENAIPSLEETKAVLNAFPNEMIMMWAKSNVPYTDQAMPPHTLFSMNGKVLLSCVMEGEFPGWSKDETHAPAEFYVVTDYLTEKIANMWEENDHSIDALTMGMETSLFQKEISQMILRPKGSIAFVASNGWFKVFSLNTAATELAPGLWVSDKLGQSEQTQQAEEKPMSASEKRKAALIKAGVLKAEHPITSATKPEKTESSPITGPDRIMPVPMSYDIAKRSIWMKANFVLPVDKAGKTIMPTDWEKIAGLPYSQLKVNSPLRDHAKDLSKLAEATKAAAKSVVTDLPTLVGSQQKEAVWKDLLNKLTTDRLLSPEQIQAHADVDPDWNNSFTSKDGKSYPLLLTLFWDRAHYKTMVNTYGQTAINWMASVRNELMERCGKELTEELREYLEGRANKDNKKAAAS